MAKKHAKHRKRTYERSDIPYKDRLLMNQYTSVADHRDHAARTALKIATVSLNDIERMGYIRLSRFARRQQDLTEVYYTDPVYQEAKLDERLEQIGFDVVNGRIFGATDEDGNPVQTKKWRPAKLGDQQLRDCPFCGSKARLETLPENCTRLRCSNQTCYLWWNPWTSYHSGNTEENAVQQLAAWWNGNMMGGQTDGEQ